MNRTKGKIHRSQCLYGHDWSFRCGVFASQCQRKEENMVISKCTLSTWGNKLRKVHFGRVRGEGELVQCLYGKERGSLVQRICSSLVILKQRQLLLWDLGQKFSHCIPDGCGPVSGGSSISVENSAVAAGLLMALYESGAQGRVSQV